MELTSASPVGSEVGFGRFFRTNWLWLVALLTLVALVWCFAYHRWSRSDWVTPLAYGGDGWSALAGAKALSTGELWPFFSKTPDSLGAPFIANWNDYPSVEEGLLAWWSIFVRLFGVFAGTNLTVLSAHLLAAASFYFVCWQLNYNRLLAVAGAALFALSRYSFARGLDHIVLTFYWHIPLGLLVAWWCLSDQPLVNQRRKFIFAIAVAVIHGVQNPYYTNLFCQFLAFAALYQWFRQRKLRHVLGPCLVIAAAGVTFVAVNLDTVCYRLLNGSPVGRPIVRNYSGLEIYALKPIELLIPPVHTIRFIQDWARTAYFDQAFVRGEIGASYLGVVGVVSLGLLVWSVMRRLSRGRSADIPCHFWGLVIIFSYAVVGSLNGIVGLFGVVLFRCSNRFSIAILAIVLLFLVKELTAVTRRWKTGLVILLVALLIGLGVFDQLPGHATRANVAALRSRVTTDSTFVAELERQLPPGAMVFQLPIMDYPEVAAVRGVSDYEQFRPYFYSHHLRYSYGSDKGRYREDWQRELPQIGIEGMVHRLETYGFSAILINRNGYEEGAASLLAELQRANKTSISAMHPDFVAVRLTPSRMPVMPAEFREGWYGFEGDAVHNWRWSTGNVSLVLHNAEPDTRTVHLQFSLSALKSRRVTIAGPSGTIYEQSLIGGAPPMPVTLTVKLARGENELRFSSDQEAELPGNGDPRKVAYAVHDFEISGL
jgi:hypothetical protein